MILTGNEISRRVESNEITISPFLPENVNPNSYNFRLSSQMRVYDEGVIDVRKENKTSVVNIGEDGFVLHPRRLYLATTMEKLGSNFFVPTYAARSSVARLGMFINLSAPLGDIGFVGNWTIQLYAIHPIRVYAGMCIGQMMFWHTQGEINLYKGKYQGATEAMASKIFVDFEEKSSVPPKTIEPDPIVRPAAVM